MTQAASERRLFIVNPAARGGNGRASWEAFAAAGHGPAPGDTVQFTGAPGDAKNLAAESRGFATIVAVGGDGTVGEVVSGIMARDPPRPVLGIVPMGTGNDIARQCGIDSILSAVRILGDGTPVAHDVLCIDFHRGGVPVRRHGFLYAVAGFTVDPWVAPWMKRWLPPVLAYRIGALRAILHYTAPRMSIRTANRVFDGAAWLALAANTEWAGGGSMRIAPGASTADGMANVTIAGAFSKFDACFKLLARVASGRHLDVPGVEYFPAVRLEVDSDPRAPVDVDGEVAGETPFTVEVMPAALEILGDAGSQVAAISPGLPRSRRGT